MDVERAVRVDAPTVVTHGPPWSAVPAPGPALPAEALTEIAGGVGVEERQLHGSLNGFAPPEIEKLMTLTPSMIACWTAATESELKQPCSRQTLYTITQAPGAMPLTGPRSTPKASARVDASRRRPWWSVCVPWPSESRAEHWRRSRCRRTRPAPAPMARMYVSRKA